MEGRGGEGITWSTLSSPPYLKRPLVHTHTYIHTGFITRSLLVRLQKYHFLPRPYEEGRGNKKGRGNQEGRQSGRKRGGGEGEGAIGRRVRHWRAGKEGRAPMPGSLTLGPHHPPLPYQCPKRLHLLPSSRTLIPPPAPSFSTMPARIYNNHVRAGEAVEEVVVVELVEKEVLNVMEVVVEEIDGVEVVVD